MSKRTKIWLIIAFALILIGCALFGGVMEMLKWDFTKLSTVKYETVTYDFSESIYKFTANTNTADIVFLPSENEKTTVVCYQQKNIPHTVTAEDGIKGYVLTISANDNRKWYEHIGISFGTPKITVYLPKGEYGSLLINCSTGNIKLPKNCCFEHIKVKTSTGKITASDIQINEIFETKVSTGKVKATNITCNNFVSSGNTGEIYLENVIAKKEINITRSTGNIKFTGCDAKKVHIETNTGDVKGSLLSSKTFITKTDTGRIRVPQTYGGGLCEITTDTGDIDIILQK